MENSTQKVIDETMAQEVLRIKKKELYLEKMSKVKIKEYDELQCVRDSCKKVFKVEGNLKMLTGYRGICTCPHCGKQIRVVKTRPADNDYNRLPTGQRVRKIPKDKLTKKQRRKLRAINKEAVS